MTTANASEPHWLTAYTTRTGLPDPRLAGTTAKPRHCATCRRAVLAGYDSPRCAGLAITDPYTLTPQLEAAAVILTRPTYRLWGNPGTYQLTPRTPTTIHGLALTPASTECVVVAAHDCAFPPLSTIPLPTRTISAATFPTAPPF